MNAGAEPPAPVGHLLFSCHGAHVPRQSPTSSPFLPCLLFSVGQLAHVYTLGALGRCAAMEMRVAW